MKGEQSGFELATICLFTIWMPHQHQADWLTFSHYILRGWIHTQVPCLPPFTFYHMRVHTYTDSTSSIFCLCSKAIEFSPFWHLSHSIFPYLQKWVKNVPKIQTIPQQVIWNLVFLLAPLPLYPPIHSLLCTCVCVCVCVCAWVHACAGMMCEEYNDYKN